MPTGLTLELLGPVGFVVVTLFTALAAAILRGDLMLGREYKALEKRRQDDIASLQSQVEFWRKRAERGTAFAEKATAVAERVVGGGE